MLESVGKEKHNVIKDSLVKIVGNEWVSDFPEELYAYSYDMTEHPPSEPEFVVMPKTVEEIQEIIRLANEHKIPIVPFVTGANIGGLTIPLRGGIILDLKRMDSIIRLDEDDMYVIIEPGVTFGHLNKFLKDTKFRYCYPFAPPFTSVVANALQDGLNNLSYKHGCMSEFINAIEAVLPTGELIKIGTNMVWEDKWWGRYPMPDLLGLFTGWQGMTGVVTKVALQVWPKKPFREWVGVIGYDLAAVYNFVRNVTHMEILNDLLLFSIETLKMVIGMPYGEAVFNEADPPWFVLLDVSANSQKELDAKLELIENAVVELNKEDPRAFQTTLDILAGMFGPAVGNVKNLPITISGMLEYGGLTWVGTYMTTKAVTVVKGVWTAFDIIKKYGFETCLYTRSMRGHHYFAFRFLLRFDKGKDGETERMRQMNKELFEALFDLGAFPYKNTRLGGGRDS